MFDLLVGDGPASYPAAAAPANDVSLAEVMRDTWDVLRNGTGGAEPATNRSIMDYQGVTPAFFMPGLGFAVTKSGSHAAATSHDLFTVTGKVLITLLAGEVTTVIDTTTTLKLRIKTDNVDLCAATTITTDADGTQYLLTGDFGDTLNGGVAPVLRAADKNSLGGWGFVVGDAGGTATIEDVLDGAGGGVVLWTLYYMPLEAGASVVAA